MWFEVVYTFRSGCYRFLALSDGNVQRRRQPLQFRHSPPTDKLNDAHDILRVATNGFTVAIDML